MLAVHRQIHVYFVAHVYTDNPRLKLKLSQPNHTHRDSAI